MNTIDVVILALMLWALYNGWVNGLLKEISSTAGFFVGLYVAYTCYENFGSYLAPKISSNFLVQSYLVPIIAFVLLWAVVPIVLGLVASILTKSVAALKLGKINSMGGMFVSMAKYIILLSFIFNVMNHLHILSSEKKKDSVFYEMIAAVVPKIFQSNTLPFKKDSQNVDDERTGDMDTTAVTKQI